MPNRFDIGKIMQGQPISKTFTLHMCIRSQVRKKEVRYAGPKFGLRAMIAVFKFYYTIGQAQALYENFKSP